MSDWLKPGARLLECKEYSDGYTGNILVVEKVYKTGRFKVYGKPKSWRVDGLNAVTKLYELYGRGGLARFLTDDVAALIPNIIAYHNAIVARDDEAELLSRILPNNTSKLPKGRRN